MDANTNLKLGRAIVNIRKGYWMNIIQLESAKVRSK